MHLVERYSLASSSKIDRPFIFAAPFPLPFTKYITFHSTSKGSKTYDLWDDVLSIILPELEKHNIKIVQIGGKEDLKFHGLHNLCGLTDFSETAGLLKNSLLHFGVDSFPAHIAGSFNIPSVILYSNNYINCVRPYWHHPESVFLEPTRPNGGKPSFSLEESPKSINMIPPNKIAEHILSLLKINNVYPYKYVAVGDSYFQKYLENVPNQVIDIRQFGVDHIIERFDLCSDLQILSQQLSLNKCVIVTDREIPIDFLAQFKNSIISINYLVSPSSTATFVNQTIKLGISTGLISYYSSEELDPIKQQFYKVGPIFSIPKMSREILLEKYKDQKLFYKSNKVILSRGKMYLSIAAMNADKPVDSLEHAVEEIIDSPDFWKETSHFCILKNK